MMDRLEGFARGCCCLAVERGVDGEGVIFSAHAGHLGVLACCARSSCTPYMATERAGETATRRYMKDLKIIRRCMRHGRIALSFLLSSSSGFKILPQSMLQRLAAAGSVIFCYAFSSNSRSDDRSIGCCINVSLLPAFAFWLRGQAKSSTTVGNNRHAIARSAAARRAIYRRSTA